MPDTRSPEAGTRSVVDLTKDPRCPGIGCPKFGCEACKRFNGTEQANAPPAAGPGVAPPARSNGRGQEKKSNKKDAERGDADGRVRSRSPVPQVKAKAKATEEKTKAAVAPPILPEMEPTPSAGWTAHNLEARRQYTAYLELEILGGSMCREEADGFLAGISQLVEANDGEVNRKAAEEAAAAAAQTKAKSYKETIQRYATLEGAQRRQRQRENEHTIPFYDSPGQVRWHSEEFRHHGSRLAARARDAADQDQQRLQAAAAPG